MANKFHNIGCRFNLQEMNQMLAAAGGDTDFQVSIYLTFYLHRRRGYI